MFIHVHNIDCNERYFLWVRLPIGVPIIFVCKYLERL